jgi:hypothetical protein
MNVSELDLPSPPANHEHDPNDYDRGYNRCNNYGVGGARRFIPAGKSHKNSRERGHPLYPTNPLHSPVVGVLYAASGLTPELFAVTPTSVVP